MPCTSLPPQASIALIMKWKLQPQGISITVRAIIRWKIGYLKTENMTVLKA